MSCPASSCSSTEVVAGPVTGGALLAHTIAGLLDSRRSLTHPPCSFAPFNYDPAGGFTLRAVLPSRAQRQARAARRRRAEYGRDVRPRAPRSSQAAGGTVVATVEIYDRLRGDRRSRRRRTSRWRNTAPRRTTRRARARCARRECQSRASRLAVVLTQDRPQRPSIREGQNHEGHEVKLATESQSHRGTDGADHLDGRREAAHETGLEPKHERVNRSRHRSCSGSNRSRTSARQRGPTHRRQAALLRPPPV